MKHLLIPCLIAVGAYTIGLSVGFNAGISQVESIGKQRDAAIAAAQSLSVSFESMHKSFLEMEKAANTCLGWHSKPPAPTADRPKT